MTYLQEVLEPLQGVLSKRVASSSGMEPPPGTEAKMVGKQLALEDQDTKQVHLTRRQDRRTVGVTPNTF